MSRLQPHQRDEITAAYTSGTPVAQLSRTYQVTTRSIYRLLCARGVPTHQRRVPAATKQHMVEDYCNGQPPRQIAATYNVSYGTVLLALRRRGPQRLPLAAVGPLGQGTVANAVAVALRAALTEQTAGMLFPRISAIARHFAVSNSTAYNAANILVAQGFLKPIPYRAYLVRSAVPARRVKTAAPDIEPDTTGPTMRG